MKKEIVLASSSENRKALLDSLGIPFRVVPSYVDESRIQDEDPIKRVKMLAQAKAHASSQIANGLIIAADTFSIYAGKKYEKPKDLKDAKRMMRELSGQRGESITGICIFDSETNEEVSDHRVVYMQCKSLTDNEIDEYINSRPVTNWAAAYNPLDELSAKIFTPIGDYTYKIEYYGLPIDVVAQALKKIGFEADLTKFKAK